MIHYKGTKQTVLAQEMTKGQYHQELSLSPPDNPDECGYMVITPSVGNTGSVSWVSEEDFLNEYEELEPAPLSEDDIEILESWLENEDFDYVFSRGSRFVEIDHPEFHRRIRNYLKARKELQSIIPLEC